MVETARPQSAGRELYYRDASGDQPGARSEAESSLRSAGQKTQSTAKQFTQQAADKAAHLAQQAQASAHSNLRQRKNDIAERLNGLAASIREAGHTLEERKTGMNAEYADTAADQVERLAEYLRQHDVQDFWNSIETQARRRPALFLGGAFAIGLVAARFLHSSAQRRRELERESWQVEEDERLMAEGESWRSEGESASSTGIHPPTSPSAEPYVGPSTPPEADIPPDEDVGRPMM